MCYILHCYPDRFRVADTRNYSQKNCLKFDLSVNKVNYFDTTTYYLDKSKLWITNLKNV